MRVDVLIFGGGIAGLWSLDELRRAGYTALLLESHALGSGQTVCSQGIIHGGLKYTLSGLLNPAAEAIREMPLLWRECLAGRREPNLSGAHVRAQFCHLWRTESLRSRAGMIGARLGLRVAPTALADDERPDVLSACPGDVARLDEQVIDPASVLRVLQDRNRLWVRLCAPVAPGDVIRAQACWRVRVGAGAIEAGLLLLCAGKGNAALRAAASLPGVEMQTRPLHMAMVRGPALPELNGHCVDGAKTRLTITTARHAAGARVWQLGGQLAEDGVGMSSVELIAHARDELAACIPGFDAPGLQWGSYRADRAELAQRSGVRPDGATIISEPMPGGGAVTLWPTKLALAPRAAAMALHAARAMIPFAAHTPCPTSGSDELDDLAVPAIETPPWDCAGVWT